MNPSLTPNQLIQAECPHCHKITTVEPAAKAWQCESCRRWIRNIICPSTGEITQVHTGEAGTGTFVCPHCGQAHHLPAVASLGVVATAAGTPTAAHAPLTARLRTNPKVVAWAVVIGLVVVVWVAVSSLGGSSTPVSASIDSISPLDSANLAVTATFTNGGDKPAKVECTIEARDAGDFSVGFDIFTTTEEVAAHSSQTATGTIRIEDEGAYRVREAVAKDCHTA